MKKYFEHLKNTQVKGPGWHEIENHPGLAPLLQRMKDHYYHPDTKQLEYWHYCADSPFLRQLANDIDVPFETIIDWFYEPEYQKVTQGSKFNYCDYNHPEMQSILDGVKQYFAEHYNLDPQAQRILLHVQGPGDWYPLHLDYVKNPAYWKRTHGETVDEPPDYARYLVFFDDWQSGQMVEMNGEFLKWKACDVLTFDFPNSIHATANVGFEDRFLITVTGKFLKK